MIEELAILRYRVALRQSLNQYLNFFSALFYVQEKQQMSEIKST